MIYDQVNVVTMSNARITRLIELIIHFTHCGQKTAMPALRKEKTKQYFSHGIV